MGQQRIRRKRQRGFQKPDTVIVVLASLTFILLTVWCSLYWKESSERSHVARSNEEPSTASKMFMLEEQVGNNPDVNAKADGVPLPKADGTTEETITQTETQKPTESQTANTAVPESPNVAESNSPLSDTLEFEQEIVQVQAICTKNMEAIQSGVDTSLQQLNKTDPVAIQAWKEKWTNELSVAEAKCDNEFLEVSRNAEQNHVSETVIKEWQQTFNQLKKKLYGESGTKKLEYYMGG